MSDQPAERLTAHPPPLAHAPRGRLIGIRYALVVVGTCAMVAFSVHMFWVTEAGAAMAFDRALFYSAFLLVCAAAPFALAALWRKQSGLARDPLERARPRWLSPVVASAVLSVGIGSLALLLYQLSLESLERSVQRRLEAVGTLKASLVEAWINDSGDDIRIWTTTPEFFTLIEDWRGQGPGNLRAREQLIGRLHEHARTSQYAEIGLLDPTTGELLLTTGAATDSFDSRRRAIAAASSLHPVLDEAPSAYKGEREAGLNVGFFGAIQLPGSAGKLVIHVGIDPKHELFPVIEQWPGESATAEMLLLRREGASMVVLNDPVTGPAGSVARRLDARSPRSIGAALLEGKVGHLEGLDDRNQPVLAFARQVDGTSWILVAKLNRVEAFAELNRIAALAGASAGALLLVGAWWWLQQRRHVALERQHQLERAEQAVQLAELSRRVVAVQEHERRQLASELHDRTGANLAAININLKSIANAAPSHRPNDEALMQETHDLLADTIASIRDFCGELRPAVLDYAGLAPAIEHHLQLFARRTGIEAELDSQRYGDRCAPPIESVLFRIAQEALLNCAKHSRANKVSVSLSSMSGQIELVIADDGIGFVPEQLGLVGQAGNGLLHMRERAAFAGGTFALETGPGQGTRITVQIG